MASKKQVPMTGQGLMRTPRTIALDHGTREELKKAYRVPDHYTGGAASTQVFETRKPPEWGEYDGVVGVPERHPGHGGVHEVNILKNRAQTVDEPSTGHKSAPFQNLHRDK